MSETRTYTIPNNKLEVEEIVAEKHGSLVAFAANYLLKNGMLDADSDYNGWLGMCVLELFIVESKQGHSGFSSAVAVELFQEIHRLWESNVQEVVSG